MANLTQALARAMRDLEGGPVGDPGTPQHPYRSRPNALFSGLRVTVGILVTVSILTLCGWPQTSLVVVQIAALLGISTTTPDPTAFGKGLPLMIACATVVAGITQFLVLDGSDAFPLLMLAMAPPIIGAGMLTASGRPRLAGLGSMLAIFLPILLSLNNPQSYNPQTFLTLALFSVIAGVAFAIILTTLFRAGAERRLAWMLLSARADLRKASSGRLRGRAAAGWPHRDADRLGQAGALVAQGHGNDQTIAELLRISDLTAAALRRLPPLSDPVPGCLGWDDCERPPHSTESRL